MYRTVLIALDGSKNAEKTLPILEPVLRSEQGKAVLVQVLPSGEPSPTAAAQAYLKSIVRKLRRRKVKAESEVARGDAAMAIIRSADRRKADLVAFTSHGLGGLSQWVFGSVAQKILRGCARPLLVVKGARGKVGGPDPIIVALDGSKGSEATLPHACTFARAADVEIRLLHAARAAGIEAEDSKLRGWLEREKRRMETRFCEIEREEPDVRFEQAIVEGDPATCIIEQAQRNPGGLLIVGSHGRTGLSRWMYGSVSEKVLQAATLPVLVARHKKQ